MISLSQWILLFLSFNQEAKAGIHSAPITIPASYVSPMTRHPLSLYRLFKTNAKGKAEPIPFQIDELDEWGDFVLSKGKQNNGSASNFIFDGIDELTFMGNDVGPRKQPTSWPDKRPPLLYELVISNGKTEGAVYVGVYFFDPPPLSKRNYVAFNMKNHHVETSRFLYHFDPNNYLVVKGIDKKKRGESPARPMIDQSAFYLRADLKYLPALTLGHDDFESRLEAFKQGPIRTIVRVGFNYSLLLFQIELGMYTEVSFFSNSVVLPAVMYNPLEGNKSLNTGSGFYYGFAVTDNPEKINLDTNMPYFDKVEIEDFHEGKKRVLKKYNVTSRTDDYIMYLEVTPSKQMRNVGNAPLLYREDKRGDDLQNRGKGAKPLGKAPVNLAMFFDLTGFTEGLHEVGFRIFFDNIAGEKQLKEFKELGRWYYYARKITAPPSKKSKASNQNPTSSNRL